MLYTPVFIAVLRLTSSRFFRPCRHEKDDTLYLEMMVDHLDAIKAYTPSKQSDFLIDIQKRDAILLRLQRSWRKFMAESLASA